MTVAVLLMELCVISLLLGWVWVVVASSSWPAPWAIFLAAPLGLVSGKWIPYSWRRMNWFDAIWWAAVAAVVAVLAEGGNNIAAGATSATRWNVLFFAGLLLAWRGWTLAEGWIDREMVETELQVGTVVVLGALVAMIWVVPGAGLVPSVGFMAAGLLGLGLARRAERRDPRASLESDWLVLVGGLVLLVVLVAVVVVALITPEVLLALYEQALLVAGLIFAGVMAVFEWIGSFFPTVNTTLDQMPPSGPGGPMVSATPPPPSGDLPVPQMWMLELFLTFVGIVFLIFAGRALYRLLRTSLRPIDFSLPRQREAPPPLSTPDTFTWAGWWRTVLGWLRAWLGGSATPGGRASQGRDQAAEEVAEQRSIRALYRELLAAAARAGFERRPSTTPNELAREVNRARPTVTRAMSAATELYVRARYGEERVGRDELARMRSAVQEARRDLSQPPPASPPQQDAAQAIGGREGPGTRPRER